MALSGTIVDDSGEPFYYERIEVGDRYVRYYDDDLETWIRIPHSGIQSIIEEMTVDEFESKVANL